MQITYLRDTSPTKRTCPTLYRTDRGTFVVQGKKIGGAVILRSLGLCDGEAAVEVPLALLTEIAVEPVPSGNSGNIRPMILIRAVPRDAFLSSISGTSRGTFVVRGAIVTDPEALAAMDIPADETAVEVPRELLPEVCSDAA